MGARKILQQIERESRGGDFLRVEDVEVTSLGVLGDQGRQLAGIVVDGGRVSDLVMRCDR